MPYSKLSDANKTILGIKPPVTLDQANAIAAQADAIGGDVGWPTAIKSFKKTHTVRNRKWVERKDKMDKMDKTKETEVTEPVKTKEMEYLGQSYIPMDVTSFAQLRIQEETEEIANDVNKITEQFTGMLWNIIHGMDEDKLAAVRLLANEFIGELDYVLSSSVESGEAIKPEGGDTISNEPVIESLTESFEGAIVLQEDAEKPNVLYADVQIIKPGWGNTHDNHYYPREMLERDAGVFAGTKMFETDHHDNEKSTRTWVSTIQEITGFTDEGAPIARVAIIDDSFSSKLRNLNAANMLEKMECSILANGRAKGGFEQDGRKGKIVEAITEVSSVDWVTKAGAGGKVLNLAETEMPPDAKPEPVADPEPVQEAQKVTIQEQEIQPVEPEKLMEDGQIKAILAASRLPVVSQERLLQNMFRDPSELKAAIAKEMGYIKSVSGSGRPFGLSESDAPTPKPVDFAEINRRKDEVNQKHLGVRK